MVAATTLRRAADPVLLPGGLHTSTLIQHMREHCGSAVEHLVRAFQVNAPTRSDPLDALYRAGWHIARDLVLATRGSENNASEAISAPEYPHDAMAVREELQRTLTPTASMLVEILARSGHHEAPINDQVTASLHLAIELIEQEVRTMQV